MEIPAGVHVINAQLKYAGESVMNTDKTYVHCLLKNMYGLKQVGQNWYNHLTDDLIQIRFLHSKVDKCLFFWSDCIIVLFISDSLIFSPNDPMKPPLVTSSNIYGI